MSHVLPLRLNPTVRSVVLQDKVSWGWGGEQEQGKFPK